MSLLITSVQLPVRQAEALVSPAASVISYALVMDQLTSTKQPPELLRQATQQCIKTFNTAKFLSSTHREEIKKAWCGSTAVGGTLEQIGLLINTVCGFREKCLADLQKTLDRLLKSLGTKNVINFQPLCTALITLFGQSIKSYCAANEFTGGTSIVSQPPKGPPSKGGNGTNKTSSTQPPSPNFLTGLLSRVQSAIEKIWNNCKNLVFRLINPKCKPSSQKPPQKPPQKPTEELKKTKINETYQKLVNQELQDKGDELAEKLGKLMGMQIALVIGIVDTTSKNKTDFLSSQSTRNFYFNHLGAALRGMIDMEKSRALHISKLRYYSEKSVLSQSDLTDIYDGNKQLTSKYDKYILEITMLINNKPIATPSTKWIPSPEERTLLHSIMEVDGKQLLTPQAKKDFYDVLNKH